MVGLQSKFPETQRLRRNLQQPQVSKQLLPQQKLKIEPDYLVDNYLRPPVLLLEIDRHHTF